MAHKKASFGMVIVLAALLFGLDPRSAKAQVGQWTNGGLSGFFNSVVVDPSDPWRLYSVASSGSVFTSEDAGESWSQMGLPFDHVTALTVSPSRLGALYAFDRDAGARVFSSRDRGLRWNLTAFQSPDYPWTVAVDPTNVSRVYAGTERGLAKSTDGGASWEDLKLRAAETRRIYDILFPPRDPSTVYVVDADYSYYPNYTVDKTTDGGKTWTTIVFGPAHLVIDPFNSSTLFGASCPGFYRSTDAGTTWTQFQSQSLNACYVSALVPDPVRQGRLYASVFAAGPEVPGGVMRSLDGGNTWDLLGTALAGFVTDLAIDPAGKFLHASTSEGVFDLRLADTRASPCEPGPNRLCLLGGRFEVGVMLGGSAAAQAVPQGDLFGSFRRPRADTEGSEIFVKMADGRALPNPAFWFFHSSVTDFAYTITVTDTTTGRMRFYRNERENPACGAADTGAFVERAASAGGDPSAASTLAPGDGDTLSLVGGQFEATVSVVNPFTGTTQSGLAMPQTDRLGYFSFPSVTGDPTFPEVFVAILDPSPFERTLSHTGLTNLQYTLRVRDRETGFVTIYQNNRDDVFNLCGGFHAWVVGL